jgi:signal-transduction protein with cAMP-binding, CBS, and nucleotidyltransferase domain
MKTAGIRITRSILTIPQNGSINNVAKIIYTNEVGSLLVTHNNNFIGVITKIELILKVLTNNLNSESTRVAEVIFQLLISISLMNLPKKSSRHLTVSLHNEVVGSLSTKDLL